MLNICEDNMQKYIILWGKNWQNMPYLGGNNAGPWMDVVSSINKKACLLACLLENSTKFTQPLILETYLVLERIPKSGIQESRLFARLLNQIFEVEIRMF